MYVYCGRPRRRTSTSSGSARRGCGWRCCCARAGSAWRSRRAEGEGNPRGKSPRKISEENLRENLRGNLRGKSPRKISGENPRGRDSGDLRLCLGVFGLFSRLSFLGLVGDQASRTCLFTDPRSCRRRPANCLPQLGIRQAACWGSGRPLAKGRKLWRNCEKNLPASLPP